MLCRPAGQSDFGSMPRFKPRDRRIIDLVAHTIFTRRCLDSAPAIAVAVPCGARKFGGAPVCPRPSQDNLQFGLLYAPGLLRCGSGRTIS